jgi:predicted ABC-type transport system involved in lysophospholipase L1 biosynthesis ATPase subunit
VSGSAGQPGAPPAPLVQVQAVCKIYREAGAETEVLRDASLELARGETASLIGVSGSGKTTLMSLLAGLMRPDSGEVVFDGERLSAMDDAARARLRARRIGVVLQSGNLIPFLTAAENVELAIELGGDGRRANAAARARKLLAEVELGHRTEHLPRRMSGGEAQRVSVAMALANEPDLLLADEVTGQLDSTTSEHVMGVILGAWRARGLTVLFVTHNGELAARAQRRLRLEDGRVLAA